MWRIQKAELMSQYLTTTTLCRGKQISFLCHINDVWKWKSDVIDLNHMNDDALASECRSCALKVHRKFRESFRPLGFFRFHLIFKWISRNSSKTFPISKLKSNSCKLLWADHKLIRFRKDCTADKSSRLSFVKNIWLSLSRNLLCSKETSAVLHSLQFHSNVLSDKTSFVSLYKLLL